MNPVDSLCQITEATNEIELITLIHRKYFSPQVQS